MRRINGAPAFPTVDVSAGHLPREYECQFRGRLSRTFEQPELSRRDIWYVDPEGGYRAKAAHDVRMALTRQGFDWFEALQNQASVLRILRESDPSETLWGFGARGSPARALLLEQLSTKA